MKGSALPRGKMGEDQFKYQRENNNTDSHVPFTRKLEAEILKGRFILPLIQAFIINRMLKYSYHETKSRHGHRKTTGYRIRQCTSLRVGKVYLEEKDIIMLLFYPYNWMPGAVNFVAIMSLENNF